jgi:type IV pilus assembly protein PilV
MRHTNEHGFALLELLIAAAVLALGLLGSVALLVVGLGLERDATNLATAATLAADLAERIRANPAGGDAYSYDPDAPPSPLAPGCTLGMPVDAPSRAACDLAEWRQTVAAALPDARVRLSAVGVSGTASRLYSIEIRWTAWRDGDDGRVALQLQAQG